MDIEYIKEKICHLDEQRKIQPGEYLSLDVIKILQDGNTTDRLACFAPIGDTKESCLFISEITCSRCTKKITKALTKTKLLEYLKKKVDVLCDECELELQNIKKQNKERNNIARQKYFEKIARITDDYIQSYLDPSQTWDAEIPSYERTKLIVGRSDIDYTKVEKHIKNMSYKDFLKTPYWFAISAYKKYKTDYKCALCGGNKQLATHHRSYERHGQEHLYQVINEDLIVLCKDCHSEFHDKF